MRFPREIEEIANNFTTMDPFINQLESRHG